MTGYTFFSEKGGREENGDAVWTNVQGNTLCAALADGYSGQGLGRKTSDLLLRLVQNQFQKTGLQSERDFDRLIEEVKQELSFQNPSSGRAKPALEVLRIDSREAIWMHSGTSGLFCLKDGRLVEATKTTSHKVSGILPLDTGSIYCFLLCSDGFREYVSEKEMEDFLRVSSSPEEWLKKMRKWILQNAPENRDNCSAVAVWLEGKEYRNAAVNMAGNIKEETHQDTAVDKKTETHQKAAVDKKTETHQMAAVDRKTETHQMAAVDRKAEARQKAAVDRKAESRQKAPAQWDIPKAERVSDRRKKHSFPWLILLIVLVLAAGAGFGVYQWNNYRLPSTTEECFSQGMDYYQGINRSQNYRKARRLLEKAAESDHAEASYYLANLYYYGYGVTRNVSRALEYYQKAAELGHAKAQYQLGCLYYYGIHVTQSYSVALEWFKQSAAQNDTPSMNMIGRMREDGLGLNQSLEKACVWYRKAADLGDEESRRKLNSLYEQGLLAEKPVFTESAEPEVYQIN